MAIETERIKFDECPVPALVADAASDRDKRETAFKTCTSDLGKDIYRFAATKGHSENGRRFWQAVTTTPRGPVLLTVTCDSDFALDTHVFGQRAECGIGIWHGDDPRSGYLVNRLTICREYQPETRDIRTSVKVEETYKLAIETIEQSLENDTLVLDAYAEWLGVQKRYDEAISMYQQLIIKQPNNKAAIESKIDSLKKLK